MAESLHEMAKRWLAAHFITNQLDAMFLFCEALRDGVDDDLRAWAAANPVKSYWMDFAEKFPNARGVTVKQAPGCPHEIYHGSTKTCDCDDCRKCWDAPLGTWGEKEKNDA